LNKRTDQVYKARLLLRKNPLEFWSETRKVEQQIIFRWIASKLNIWNLDDWYNVRLTALRNYSVSLHHCPKGNSLYSALLYVFPEHQWIPWRFLRFPQHFWKDIQLQRFLFEAFAREKLGLRTLDDWYRVRVRDLRGTGRIGCRMIHVLDTIYGSSLSRALSTIFSEHPWQPWKFHSTCQNFWDHEENVRQYLRWVAQALDLHTMDDWNKISWKRIRTLKASCITQKHGGLLGMLRRFFPEQLFKWQVFGSVKRKRSPLISLDSSGNTSNEEKRLSSFSSSDEFGFNKENGYLEQDVHVSKTQLHLLNILRNSFPLLDVLLNYRHPHLFYRSKSQPMEIDLYIPAYSLAFEYHGEQHFQWSYKYGSEEKQKLRDSEKREMCEKFGLTLIEIPFWWNQTTRSLMQTVHKHRPDLIAFTEHLVAHNELDVPLPKYSTLLHPNRLHLASSTASRFHSLSFDADSFGIPEKNPRRMKRAFPLSTADDVLMMMAKEKCLDATVDPTDWWLFERRFGSMRALWNGIDKLLLENGAELLPPRSLALHFPEMVLDGYLEFQCGESSRLSFQDCKEISKKDVQWWLKHMRFYIFDVLQSQLRFEQRVDLLKTAFEKTYIQSVHLLEEQSNNDSACNFLQMMPMWRCKGLRDLHLEMRTNSPLTTSNSMGRKLMLRKPMSFYYESIGFLYCTLN